MTPVITSPAELRQRGFDALVASLGWVNAVRFLHQYEVSQQDYTKERQQILPEWDAETLARLAREHVLKRK
jgi:hypothetical protein